jgi:hypothetical protein
MAMVGATVLTAASCTRQPSSVVLAGDTAGAKAHLTQLEADARALVQMAGCSADAQCRTAPVGQKACGGPRTYLVYCSASTDSAALYRKLDLLKAAEQQYNRDAGIASTCEFRLPPAVSAQGGSCREAAP